MSIRKRMILSVYIIMISYLMMTLIAGPGGLRTASGLNDYLNALSRNLEELAEINTELSAASERLLHDTGDIRLKARELGYFDDKEGIIFLNGYSIRKNHYSMGKLLGRDFLYPPNQDLFRIISVICGVVFFVSAGFLNGSGRKQKCRMQTSGVSVQAAVFPADAGRH